MRGKRHRRGINPGRIFLNVPYSSSYEKLLVALTAAILAVGRVPRLTFQVRDGGQGRLRRIFTLLKSCPISIHDLSAVGQPVRFNMPFELGLACAIKQQKGRHDFLIFEKEAHRINKHLSDVGGIDPKIHGGTARGAISAVLETLGKPSGNPSTAEVMKLYRRMTQRLPWLKSQHGDRHLFSPRVYEGLVMAGWLTARELNLN